MRSGPAGKRSAASGWPARTSGASARRYECCSSTGADAVKVAADARRHLKALLVTAPESLRAGLRGGTWLRQAHACAALTAAPSDPVEYRATVRA
jgi:hypothetical protein